MADETTGNGAGASPRRWWHDRRKLIAAIAAAVVVLGAGAAIAYNALKRPDDVHNTDVAFKEEKERPPVAKTVNWPMFGYDRARTRYLSANKVKPPFKRIWKYGDNPLLEFPPIFVRTPRRFCKPVKGPGTGCDRLFFVNNNGEAFALDADTGKIVWQRDIAELNASSPAYSKGKLFVVNLDPGQVVSLDAKTGKTLWERPLPGRSESSPMVIGDKVIFGCENGEMFAVSANTGKTKWSTQLGGEIKAAPAYRDGTLYVGDYSGTMSAVKARNGEIRWQSDGLGLSFGRAGGFYSTPAVAFGRVYNGNKDSRVYSFDAKTGEVAWTYSTSSYVYSGGTVADTKNTPPTIYIGSYDGNVYALDARSGEPRWIQSAGGSVMGSLSVIGDVVYASTFEGTNTSGFKLKGGKKVFDFHTGAYTPAISDGRRLYLTGYSSIHALDPVSPQEAKAAKQARRQAKQKGKKG